MRGLGGRDLAAGRKPVGAQFDEDVVGFAFDLSDVGLERADDLEVIV